MDSIISLDFDTYRTELVFRDSFPISSWEKEKRKLFIFDGNTDELFGRDCIPKIVLPGGEAAKNWDSAGKILTGALEKGLARDSLFIAVGGGIVCDIGAFSASVFMRGCRVVLVPTTLLSMVDASLGGKTGFNFGGYKNMVGTFYPAESVIIIPEVLQSLSEKEILAGTAENIKHACLGDEYLFRMLEDNPDRVLRKDTDFLSEVIMRSVTVKADIVRQDLREEGVRAYLNLGHTFAHALESCMALRESQHGEAVAWGLCMAMRAGMMIGLTDEAYGGRVIELVRRYGYDLNKKIDPEKFLQAMGKDKKQRQGKIRFVLQEGMGKTLLREIDEEIIRAVIGP